MKMKIKSKALVFYQNLTPLHMGTGTEIGFVDLPIQREKVTGFPKGEASGIKGAFKGESEHPEWFGKERQNDNTEGDNTEDDNNAGNGWDIGSFRFTDARLLFFPVREYGGKLFVWVTCPFVLKRYYEEIKDMGICKTMEGCNIGNKVPDDKTAYPLSGSDFVKKLYLEDFEFNVVPAQDWQFPAERLMESEKSDMDKLKNSLYLISDTMFSYFCEMSTEVQTRIRIGENGVVEDGALFQEEFLPEYAFLYNFIEQLEINEKADLTVMLDEPHNIIQLGGDMTLGKGICKYRYFVN